MSVDPEGWAPQNKEALCDSDRNSEGCKILVTQNGTALSSADELPSESITLVLLPGLDGTDVFFRPLLAALPEWISPVVVQFPPSGANEYPDLLAVVRNMLTAIRSYYVLGWSFSGPLALMLATAEPEKVQGVVLASTFVRPPRRIFAQLRWAAMTPTVWMIRVGKRLPVWLSRTSTDQLRQDKRETWKRVTAQMIAARIRTLLAVDARHVLKRCPCPVLCVAGHDDGIVPYRNVEEMARVRESMRVRMIAGGHFAIYTNPAGASEAITEFIIREMG
ncbi:MAG: alpha/beta hydrolase [Nitrospira sp.]|nr:alpha/beta hydrolase [Nitrospira sp.]